MKKRFYGKVATKAARKRRTKVARKLREISWDLKSLSRHIQAM